MSTADTMTPPLISAPWFDADGNPLPIRILPGLHLEVIRSFECSYPGVINTALKGLLEACCGLADTELGDIDFTGCWFPAESCAVFLAALRNRREPRAMPANAMQWPNGRGRTFSRRSPSHCATNPVWELGRCVQT